MPVTVAHPVLAHTGGVRAADFPYFDSRFQALAHRGGAGYPANVGRENTLHAFGQAVSLGYRYLETDVHATADGVLVAFHDDDLDALTDASGSIAALPHQEVARARIGGTDPIPTLDELLETFPDARFNIDLKGAGAIRPLARTLAAHRAELRVCVGSFSIERIRAFRRLTGNRVATASSRLGAAWYAYAVGARRFAPSAGVALQIPLRAFNDRVPLLHRGLVEAAHRAGRAVHVWTIDDADQMDRLIDLGVDGLVSDRIDVLKDVLVSRGLWEGTR